MRRALPGTDAGIPCEKRAGPASEVKVCAAELPLPLNELTAS